jgi:hypothetical protein
MGDEKTCWDPQLGGVGTLRFCTNTRYRVRRRDGSLGGGGVGIVPKGLAQPCVISDPTLTP